MELLGLLGLLGGARLSNVDVVPASAATTASTLAVVATRLVCRASGASEATVVALRVNEKGRRGIGRPRRRCGPCESTTYLVVPPRGEGRHNMVSRMRLEPALLRSSSRPTVSMERRSS